MRDVMLATLPDQGYRDPSGTECCVPLAGSGKNLAQCSVDLSVAGSEFKQTAGSRNDTANSDSTSCVTGSGTQATLLAREQYVGAAYA